MNQEFATEHTIKTENLPSLEALYAAGYQFAEEDLSEIFPKLLERVQKTVQERGLSSNDVQFIFLDRDARPSLHAWQQYTDHRFSSIPLVVSRAQLAAIAREFGHYYWNQVSGTPFTPEEITEEFKQYILKGTLRGKNREGETDHLEWLYTLSQLLIPKLRDKKHVVIIDTGYMGSMLYTTQYIINTLVPNTNGRTTDIVMFFGNGMVSAANYLKFGASEKHEDSIPHATSGYKLDRENFRMSYIRDSKRLAAEKAYIRGCVDYVKQHM